MPVDSINLDAIECKDLNLLFFAHFNSVCTALFHNFGLRPLVSASCFSLLCIPRRMILLKVDRRKR